MWVGLHLNRVKPEPLIVSLVKYDPLEDRVPVLSTSTPANLVSSETRKGTHKPVIDLDCPATLVPSTEVGKNHLYIDVEMPWFKYATLLTALRFAGVIETGFWIWSLRRRASFVRPLGVIKTAEEYARARAITHGWVLRRKEGK